MITSVGYHSEPLKMDPDGGMSLGGNNHNDPFTGGSPPFTGGNEEEFESVQLPPGALSEDHHPENMHQPHQHPHSIIGHQQQHHQQQTHYPGHYSHQQHSYQHHHPHHQSQPAWNPYGMNGYVGSGPYHGIHHAPPMEPGPYYYSNANPGGPNGPSPGAYHTQQGPNPSAGSQGMALPGGPSPAGSHNTPSPQAHSEDGDSSSLGGDPHLRNNNVLKRPGDYSSSGVHPLMNPGGYHAPLPPAKKAKVPKRKKKRDPNEPQKPVSAYALFFRDSQANIKAANPNAAFGDVSKIVASMWDGLDPDNKAAYKKRTENAKKEYLKKLAAYRASLVSKGSGNSPINESGSAPPTQNNHPPSYGGPYASYSPYGEPGMKPSPNEGYGTGPGGPYPPSQQQQQQLPPRQQPSYGPPQPGYIHPSQQMSNGGYGHHHPIPPVSTPSDNHRSSSSPPSGSPLDSRTHLDPTTGHLIDTEGGHNGNNSNSSSNSGSGPRRRISCARPGCNNPISSSQEHSSGGWGNQEYCSNECVAVGQCRDVVYSSWSGGPPPPPNAAPPNGQVQTQ